MDWREFVASLVDSLAWPAAIVLLAFVVRVHIGGLLNAPGPLRRAELGPGGVKLEWQGLQDDSTLAVVKGVAALPVAGNTDVGPELESIEALIPATPGVAVTRAFDLLQRQLRLALSLHHAELPPDLDNPDHLIRAAFHGGAISKETGEALRGMLELRNIAAHDFSGTETTPDQARDYLALTRTVLFAIGGYDLGR